MKLVDAEKTLKDIQEISWPDKQKRILDIQKKGFKYHGKEIVEIIKDKWVFLKDNSDTDIENIDYVILEWARAEELRIEKEQAESGNTVIDKYFKKYGVLSKKEKPKDGALYNQQVYFNGEATPGDTWNTDLHMYRLGVFKSYESPHSNAASYIEFYADMKVQDLMDAKMKDDEPTIRHCHNWYTNPHTKAVNHYKHENWLEDIEAAKSLFIMHVNLLLKDYKTFQYSEKKNIFCVPEEFVFWFEEKADHNGDETNFFRSPIYSTRTYKGSGYSSNTLKTPAKFDKTVTREEIIEMAMNYCEDKLTKHNFRKEFKY